MSRLLRMPEAASLGLHAAVLVAGSPDRPVPARALAEALDASEAHLAKVMPRLVKAGLANSTRGPKGGFMLDRPADRISLLEVYEAIEGPVELAGCVFGRPVCGRGECIFGGFVADFEARFLDYLANTSLAALADYREAETRQPSRADG